MVALLMLWACSGDGQSPTQNEAAAPPPGPQQPGPQGNGPMGNGPMGMGPGGGGSGAQHQDPCGFPGFHDQTAPTGPSISALGSWTNLENLTDVSAGGGYRPQIAVGPDDRLHAVYYERVEGKGDLIRHRIFDGQQWSEPVHVGFHTNRNWGPDIVARGDGSLAMVFDYALEDLSSQGYLTTWTEAEGWTTPEALTEGNTENTKIEVGSGHVANAVGDDLAYVWIGKEMSEHDKFQAHWRWRTDGTWSAPAAFSDGSADAWHTNVERRPDGSVLAGFDIGEGGSETVLHVAEGRDGSFSKLENLTATGKPGERPHFAFGSDGTDHITWFHKENKVPIHIYVRSGRPGAWGPVEEPSQGYGGFHFDPEIAINDDGVRVLVWGWDAGKDAGMVYSVSMPGSGWSAPRRIAQINYGKPGLASIDVDSQGDFHVIWNEGFRCDNRVYYAKLEVNE